MKKLIVFVLVLLTGCGNGEGVGFSYETSTPELATVESTVAMVEAEATVEVFKPEPSGIIVATAPDYSQYELNVLDVEILPEDNLNPEQSWQEIVVNINVTNNSLDPLWFDVFIRSDNPDDDRLWRQDFTVNRGIKNVLLSTTLQPGETTTGDVGFKVWPGIVKRGSFEIVLVRVAEANKFKVVTNPE